MSRPCMLALVVATGCKLVGSGGTQWSTGPSSPPPSSSSSSAERPTASRPYVSPTPAPAPAAYNEHEDPATSHHHQIRKRFVSTKASAAKLNGLPGQTCTPGEEAVARERGLVGPCWDPPGGKTFAPLAHLEPGMKQLQAADFRSLGPSEIYWFDMPREARLESERWNVLPMVPGVDDPMVEYLPYGAQGFAKPKLPPLVGKPVREALAALDALDLPIWVTVEWSECEGGNDTVCQASDEVNDRGFVRLVLAMRVRYRGTPEEMREIPKGLEGKPTEEAKALLAKIGFTNVVVVEKDLPCQRGIVCSTYQPGWHKTNQLIELNVRRARSP